MVVILELAFFRIDMSRLTNKNVIAQGSGILATSIISDESFETWLGKWLEIRTRGLDKSKCLNWNELFYYR